MESNNIQITDEALQIAAGKGMDEFINVFSDKYLEVIGGNLNSETMGLLNGYQHSLLGYHFFRNEVMDGGFVQLIQNGYGAYIFDNPFAKAMRLFGAEELSKLVYKAKKIYDENKEDLMKERTDEEFMAMYEQYEAFDDLEEAYLNMEEETTAIIAEYVDNHIEQFGDIIGKVD
ncbi:MAG: DMP19 family protein [Bacteroides sp.]